MAIINGDEFGNNLFGTNENDEYFGFGGFDLLFASLGDDTLDGGSDTDVALYNVGLLTNGVFINNTDTAIGTVLAHTVDKRGFGTDTLIDVSNFHGTNFDDTIYIGGTGGTYSFDMGGDDYVEASQDPNADDHYFLAGSGNDTLVGTVARDTIDYADNDADIAGDVSQGAYVDLAAGTATDGWGDTDTLVSIEGARGTQFNDTLLGDDGRNDFMGRQGDDLLDGSGGDRDRARYRDDPDSVVVDLAAGTATDGWGGTDTLIGIERAEGSQFDDTLRGDDGRNDIEGEGGDDLIEGRGDDDWLEGQGGNDTLDGGEGVDAAAYGDAPSGVSVDLTAGTAQDGHGTTDTLISIEEISGSEFGDTLIGNDENNHIQGRGGDDLLQGLGGDYDSFRGGQGNDTIDGGDGTDRTEYHRDAERGGGAAVFVDLVAGTATDGFGDTDTLISIEDVRGTDGDDTIIGNAEDNFIEGEAGNDSLAGNEGRDTFRAGQGNDTIDGGESFVEFSGGDRVRYDREHEDGGFQGINVDLNTGVATDTFGDTDTLVSIEEIYGSVFNDTIVGTGAPQGERLQGYGGDDLIIGGGGNDDLSGGSGNDTLIGGDGGEFLTPGTGTDVIDGGDEDGIFGRDELSYFYDSREVGATQGITVNMTAEGEGTVTDYGGDIDTFTRIEQFRGTNNADLFNGTDGNQTFKGMGGDDTIHGGAGDRDRLDYRAADDDPGQVQGIVVDMVAGTATDRYGDTDTFTGIEEIRGSRFDDVIIGDNNENDLQGDQGDDLLDSFGGEDNLLDGGRGNDTIEARGDDDGAAGGDGNDLITFYGAGGYVRPGLGSDTIVGGTGGFSHIDYEGVGNDVIIDVELGTTTILGTSDVDIFTNIVNVEGGEGNDTLLGNDGERQEFFSSLGDDFIDGRGDGDDGDRDWLIYEWGWTDEHPDEQRATEVIFDIGDGTGTASGALAGNDTFVNIEAVRGSRVADRFVGSDQAYEEYQGMAGNDTIEGGGGLDRISYSFEDNRGGTMGLNIDLAGPVDADGYLRITDTFGDTDFVMGIEQVTGSAFADILAGTDEDNVLIGLEGNDTLIGRGGDDFFWGGSETDSLSGGAGADEFGGFINFLDGDTITDFSAEDSISIFDADFNDIAADATIVGNELRLDTDGDGVANATMFLENGYSGQVTVTGGGLGGHDATVFSVSDAGLFTAVVDESAVVANVTITRTGDVNSTATVDVRITGHGLNPVDAADLGVPFDTPIRLTFAPGQEQIIYQIGITDDLDIEAAEDLAFTLSNPTSDGAGGAEIDGAETYVRILNNDEPAIVRIDGEKRNEDAGELIFTVSRTGDTSEAITVPYEIASAGGLQGAEADDLVGGLPQSGSVVIAAGETQATFVVEVAPDLEAELHDDIVATISAGDDWPAGLTVGSAQATGSIRNDDGVPPVLPVGATGSNYGDPHIVTLDGLAYDFQAVGEFTLIEAASGDPLSVQVRFSPVDGSQVASQTTAVATMLGSARVVIEAKGSPLVSVDGVAFDIESAVGGASLGDGDIYFDGEAITLVYANGEQLRVDVFDGFLSTSVSIGEGRDVRGLLGNADGDAANDLALRDGTVLAQPVSFADLYGAFADEWRISDTTTMFDYDPGQGTADFTDLDFPAAGVTLDDFPIEVVAAAEAAAAGIEDPALRDAAVLDYLLSGNADFIDAAGIVDGGLDGALTETAPADAPSIPSGIGIGVSQAEISEGDSGVQSVTFTIYRTGDLSDTVELSYSLGGDVDGSDVGGALSGSLTFGAGEASREVQVEIIGDTEVEDNETLEMSFSVTGLAQPIVLSSTARIEIVNDDLAPPEPEFNEIVGTARSDYLRGTEDADMIFSLGGSFDKMFGFEGADVFVFGEETQNGRRERDVIVDYEVGVDAILLTDGTTVGSIRDTFGGAVIFFEGDRDAVYLRGSDITDENITIIYDDFSF